MAKPIEYSVVDLDLSDARDNVAFAVNTTRIVVSHLTPGSPAVFARFNTPDAALLQLAVGPVWTDGQQIEEIFITNEAGAGSLQILTGSLCADFLNAAARVEGEIIFHAVPQYTGLSSSAWRDVKSGDSIVEYNEHSGADSHQAVHEGALAAMMFSQPSAVTAIGTGRARLPWPHFPLHMFNDTAPTRTTAPGFEDGLAWELESVVSVLLVPSVAVEQAGKQRATFGIGWSQEAGTILQLLGIGFIADRHTDFGETWWTSVAPDNNAVANSDPYYDRADTGVRYDEAHKLAVRIGIRAGLPVAQFRIDDVLVHEFVGPTLPSMGAGDAGARDGSFGSQSVDHVLPTWGTRKNLADDLSHTWTLVGVGGDGIKVRRTTL